MASDAAISDTTHGDPHRFEFDLDRAIRDQVIEKLKASPLIPLSKSVGPQSSGIYVLYHNKTLVYVGKASKETTKSGRTLRARLNEHVGKIETRTNITLEELEVRYLTFASEWWLYAAEFVLMKYFSPEWNFSGFGSKTPGSGRPGTHRVSAWDKQFPLRD